MLKNTLEVMQEAVGGYIDIVELDDNVCMLIMVKFGIYMKEKWRRSLR